MRCCATHKSSLTTASRRCQAPKALLTDPPQPVEQLEAALAQVPGHGADGIRLGYLWMLGGDDQTVKPDRMVRRWFARHGSPVDAVEALSLIHAIAVELSSTERPMTPWMVDHSIWQLERARRTGRRRGR